MKTLCLPLSSILCRTEQFCLTFPIFLMMLAKDSPWGHRRKFSTSQELQATVWVPVHHVVAVQAKKCPGCPGCDVRHRAAMLLPWR